MTDLFATLTPPPARHIGQANAKAIGQIAILRGKGVTGLSLGNAIRAMRDAGELAGASNRIVRDNLIFNGGV